MAKGKSGALAWINAEAHKIRRASPGTSWKSAQSQASARYRARKRGGGGGGTPAPRKSTARRSPSRKRKPGQAQARPVKAGATVEQLKAAIRRKLTERIDRNVLAKFHATKKRVKRQYQKKITEAKAEIRKLG